MTFYIDPEALKPKKKRGSKQGRPRTFSHPLIQLLLLLKIQYRLPYRALEGFVEILSKVVDSDLSAFSHFSKLPSVFHSLLRRL